MHFPGSQILDNEQKTVTKLMTSITNLLMALLVFSTPMVFASPLGTAFTYQGRLLDSGLPANGNYDVRFILFDYDMFGFPVGPILTNLNLAVNNGAFTTDLDFGTGIFSGTNHWLEIGVR